VCLHRLHLPSHVIVRFADRVLKRSALFRQRMRASEALRDLIDAIVLTPAEGAREAHVVRRGRPARGPAEAGHYGALQIELKGNLGDAFGHPKRNEVAGSRRPRIADSVGCGGGI
jgi:hypothetical protein